MSIKNFSLALTAIALVACSSKPPKDPGPNAQTGKNVESSTTSIESKVLASEEQTSYVTEISFAEGGKTISKKAKSEIKQVIADAKKKGKVEEIKVVTWADAEYPSVHKEELAKKQQELVKNRNAALEKYIEALDDDLKVDTISMAERPNAINELFNADDARIKKSLETAGIPNTDTSIKEPGKASKSIVMVMLKE